jgi:hypothetical protein
VGVGPSSCLPTELNERSTWQVPLTRSRKLDVEQPLVNRSDCGLLWRNSRSNFRRTEDITRILETCLWVGTFRGQKIESESKAKHQLQCSDPSCLTR